jgi:hypothetical protein
MKTVQVQPLPATDEIRAHMGSEYMDAAAFVTQQTRTGRVKKSDPTFHGANVSEFGIEPVAD